METETMSQEACLSAWRFAAVAHNSQKVPGTDLPYLTHLGMVGMEIMLAHASSPIHLLGLAVQCAILHDTIEDQNVAYSTLAERFGKEVADGVAALSKNPALSKQEAMADSLMRIRAQPKAVWCVKLADRISNLQPPPAYWSREKAIAYRAEAQQILDALGDAHEVLARRLTKKIEDYPGQ